MIDQIRRFKQTRIKRGSALWYALVFPLRLWDRRLRLLKGYLDYYLIKRENERRLKGRLLQPDHVTVAIISAGRRDLLQQTIESLRENLMYDSDRLRWYIIDDYPASSETRQYIETLTGFDLKILNRKNMGLGYSLNRIYVEINTEFVFHCEDDSLFLRPIPIEQMISTLRKHPHLRQLSLYREEPSGKMPRNVRITDEGFGEKRGKFSFPPHLARTQLFIDHQPFPLNYAELEYTLKLERGGHGVGGILGYPDQPYVRHLGAIRQNRKVL